MTIRITPYEHIQNETYINGELILSTDLFNSVNYIEGKIVFVFSKCRFKKLTIKNSSKIDFRRVSIALNYCLIDDLEVSEIQSENITLSCHGCIIKGRVSSAKLRSVGLNNCIAQNLFLLNQRSINVTYTEENIFIKKWIWLIHQTDIASLSQLLTFKQNLRIHHARNIRVIFNHNKTDNVGLHRDPHGTRYFKYKYFLSENEKKNLDINLSIDFSNERDRLLKIENCILNSLYLSGNANGKIVIENSSINNLFIREFSSESEALLYNIDPIAEDSKLEIHKSNMDNAWFDNIDFNGYKLLSFYRSRFANASFTSCNFPENNLSFEKFQNLDNIHYPDKKPQNYYKDQYEIFLQLRKSLEGSGNYYEAQKVGAISKESLRKISTLSKWDKSILWIYGRSNNHGLSIQKPLYGLFVFSVIFYVLYLLSIGKIFNSSIIDWALVGHYFSFMDLTHKKDFLISKEEFSFWTLSIDFVNKVIVGFFLFQFISAFRKYVRK